jgi:hypothetical protein
MSDDAEWLVDGVANDQEEVACVSGHGARRKAKMRRARALGQRLSRILDILQAERLRDFLYRGQFAPFLGSERTGDACGGLRRCQA